jgi:hypothetical protein
MGGMGREEDGENAMSLIKIIAILCGMSGAAVKHQKGRASIKINFLAFFEFWNEDSPEPILENWH